MAIAYRSSGTSTVANSTSSGAVGLPAGLANGDTMILAVQSRGTSNTVTTPAGYMFGATVNITKSHRLSFYYKYVTNAAGEAAPTVTQSTSGLIMCRLSAFSGCDATTQLDVTSVTAKHTDLATVTASSITPVSVGAMAVWLFSSGDDNTLNAQTQGTNAYSDSTTTGVDGSLAMCYELQTTAAATGTCAMTESVNGPDNWNTITLALRPSVAAAADPSTSLRFDGITFAVEMAFGSAAFAPTPIWTDVSAYVRAEQGITITRGRNNEFSDTQPGTCSFTLNNRGRVFDPAYSSSPYSGQLVPQVRCRVRLRKSSTNYPLFDGYVQGWPQSYIYPREAVVQVTCVDLFSRLATRQMPPTALTLEALNDSPMGYWPLLEDPALVAADLTGNGNDFVYADCIAVDTFLEGESGLKAKQAIVSGGAPDYRNYGTPMLATAKNTDVIKGIECWVWVNTLTLGSNPSVVFSTLSGTGNSTLGMQLFATTDSRYAKFFVYDANSSNGFDISLHLEIGQLYHLFGTLDSTLSTMTFYVNGVAAATASISAGTFEGSITTPNDGSTTFTATAPSDVYFAHFAIYEEEISATRVAAHYTAGVTGGAMQSIPNRMTAIADFAGLIDAGLYDGADLLENGYCGKANLSGSVLSTMQQLIRTEQGRLFVDSTGVLTTQGRTADIKMVSVNTTSQATLADSGANAYADIVIDEGSLETMKNAISVSTTGNGGTVLVVDTASRTLYDNLDESIATDLGDPSAARNLGLSRTRRFADPTTRIQSVTLKPHGTSDARYPLCLGAELGWRFTIQRTPQAIGAAISTEVTVEGIQHQISEANLVTTFYLVPALPVYTAQPWFVVGDAQYSKPGTTANNQLPY